MISLAKSFIYCVILAMLFLLAPADPAHAYIGPGAGFAFISSFFIVFVAFVLAFFSIALWPLRYMVRKLHFRVIPRTDIKRVVVLGLDGLSPDVVQDLMVHGKLPTFSHLKEHGYFSPLVTTNPPISPVAWSSFQTGVNPGKHNIFDFLGRDLKTYLPVLSFSKLSKSRRNLTMGTLSLPLSQPTITLLRKSKPFWELLGEHGVFSTILRVPVTFPPGKFRGHLLSAMGAPDLKGSQGTFTCYSSDSRADRDHTGGVHIPVRQQGNRVESYLPGPDNPFLKEPQEMRVPFVLLCDPARQQAELRINGKKFLLKRGEYSAWIPISFRPLPGIAIKGITRFLIRRIEPEFEMYVTPVNIDPERPAMPVSHPRIYSVYLSKLLGSYATLGEAEDTWALNERVISEDEFRKQCALIYEERKKMFFQALKRTKTGVCACVFDTPDRMQHMFWAPGCRTGGENRYPPVIEDLYQEMDRLVGDTMKSLGKNDALFILSDHGIASFHRCFNLNTWLHWHGYLALKSGNPGSGSSDFFTGVDWTKTRAYGVGMAGLYINQKGREAQGVVASGEEKEQLLRELKEKLTGLMDEHTGEVAVRRVYDTREAYSGPYCGNGPDLIIGCNSGYRISWDSVIGKQGEAVFEDNTKHWQADHCVDTSLVPGVLFCNRKLETADPAIVDLAPTILNLFGVPIPPYMDGKAMTVADTNIHHLNFDS